MPIGKNIKKDTIIPSKKKSKDKVAQPKKVTEAKNVPDVEKIANLEKVVKVAEKISEQASVKKEEEVYRSELQKKKLGTARYMTDEEFRDRERLKSKFDNEAKTYAGRELQLICFRLGEERYAIEIGRLKEVVPTPKISRIPHAPHYVRGVSNIRGNVMVIIDLAKKFELENLNQENLGTQFTLVVQSEDFRAGVLINEVPTTLKVKGENIVSSSGILNNTALDETYIKGLIKTDDEMIIFIDIIELITDDEISIISQAISQG